VYYLDDKGKKNKIKYKQTGENLIVFIEILLSQRCGGGGNAAI
jgi:hypothetical protein